jgi:ABC-type uncharacterized transport system ATPase subunit
MIEHSGAGKTTTMSMLTGNCYDKRCKKDDYHVYVNRYLVGHNGPGKTTIMSMLTGKCWSIAVQERRLTMSMLRGNC